MSYSTRSYARGYLSHGSLPTAVRWLLIANTVMFVIFVIAARYDLATSFFRHLELIPRETVTGSVWQLVTYMFLHDPTGFLHILFNMLALWMFGKDLEVMWGTERFLRYYFTCGIGAGLCAVIGGYLVGDSHSATIGASGAIFGLLLAFGMIFPDAIIIMIIFPIKAKYFVMIAGGMAILGAFLMNGGVSNSAHVGGLLVGYISLKTWMATQRTSRFATRAGLFDRLKDQYRAWKLQRAKRKFQVYLKKHGGNGPWVN